MVKESLAAGLLTTMPADPFSGAPIIYRLGEYAPPAAVGLFRWMSGIPGCLIWRHDHIRCTASAPIAAMKRGHGWILT